MTLSTQDLAKNLVAEAFLLIERPFRKGDRITIRTFSKVDYRWRKTSADLAGILGIVIVGWVWFEQIQSMSTFLGLLSARLAIALQEPLTNLAGWGFIVWRHTFAVGDRIQVGEHAGDALLGGPVGLYPIDLELKGSFLLVSDHKADLLDQAAV